jgi:hypothetical protein
MARVNAVNFNGFNPAVSVLKRQVVGVYWLAVTHLNCLGVWVVVDPAFARGCMIYLSGDLQAPVAA